MKQSKGRIFTTHTGSLPRPQHLTEILGSLALGQPVDQAALEAIASRSTIDILKKQADSGIDIVNGGEQSRTSFSTYVTQRMSGFGGSWTRRGHKDQNEFPNIAKPRVVQIMKDVPQCVSPLEYNRLELAQNELDSLLAGVTTVSYTHLRAHET